MTEHDDYFQQDIAIGEARFWREEYPVPIKVHKSAETYRGRRDRQREGESLAAARSREPMVGESLISADGVVHFKAYAHLVSIDPSKNRYRFYTLTWQPALFDGLALVRSWGRIGTSGRSKAIFFADQDSAQKAVEGIMKRRLSHGYAVVRWE